MSQVNGAAWCNRQVASLLDCYYYYDSDTAKYTDPRGLKIYRPSSVYFDWQAQFMPYVPIDYTGTPILILNEPDNAGMMENGQPAGDNLTPLQAVIFVAEAIRRWPKVQWVGPNTVHRAAWTGEFLKQWRLHGYPLTGRERPFDVWGLHIYGTGNDYAVRHMHWFKETLAAHGHVMDKLWVTEYCHQVPTVLETWTRDIHAHPALKWSGVFAPVLKNSQELRAAYRRGLT